MANYFIVIPKETYCKYKYYIGHSNSIDIYFKREFMNISLSKRYLSLKV